MPRLSSYNCIKKVPCILRKQLQGLGYASTSDSLRSIAFGRSASDGYTLAKLVILHDKTFVLSWGILYWTDSFSKNSAQGIQLFTRKSQRKNGYGCRVYHKLMQYRHNSASDPIVHCTDLNWQLFKKCKHPDADYFAEDSFDF